MPSIIAFNAGNERFHPRCAATLQASSPIDAKLFEQRKALQTS
jgi:hypothetical protein